MEGREQQVWQAVQELNAAWTQGRVEELARWFHEEMVAITPARRERLVGRAACIAGWKGFVDAARILSWHELEPQVRIWGDTAVVTYHYRMSCILGGTRLELSGRDLMVLVEEQGHWWLVADQFSGDPGGMG